MNPMNKVTQVRIGSPLLSGLLNSFTWLLALTVFLSLFLWLTDMKEQGLGTYTYLIHCVALLFGGISSGKKTGNKGWYYGGLTGLVYCFILFIVGFLGFDSGMSLNSFFILMLSFAVGALGGMLGVNMKK